MSERALMALFDTGHRLELPGGFYLQKRDDNAWEVGGLIGDTRALMGMQIGSTIPVGRGGSMDCEIKRFADAMNGIVQQQLEQKP